MLFAAYIAICVAGTPVQDCNRETAVVWTKAPGVHSLGYCQFRGMAFAADANIAQPGEVVKIYYRSVNHQGHIG